MEKGHFVVYGADEKRFVLPLEYLKKEIVMELFEVAEVEFGLTSNGCLTLSCDATFMEYVIGFIKRNASKQVEKALLVVSLVSGHCSLLSSYHFQQETSKQFTNMGLLQPNMFSIL